MEREGRKTIWTDTTTLVFDLPDDSRRPRLFLGDPPGIERFVIGHENSLFHRKIYFEL